MAERSGLISSERKYVRVLSLQSLRTLMLTALMVTMVWLTSSVPDALGREIEEIQREGTLRHLGIPYAAFVTDDARGLDVELMRNFAAYLGVRYEFVETDWQNLVADLTGKLVKPRGDDVEVMAESPVRGDVIATGFTVLEWRKRVVDFSSPTFPTGVWVVSRADSPLQPITATGDIDEDIKAVKRELKGKSVLGLKGSCLDPDLYGLSETGALVKMFPSDRNLEEMIPAIIARAADSTLMDVPVALVALEKWPGEIKTIGPVSRPQEMACAFARTSPKLGQAFERFFQKMKADGTYKSLVMKYYPSVFTYYPDFLKN